MSDATLKVDSDKICARFQRYNVEEALAGVFGERFVEYRRKFERAKNYFLESGQVPDFPLTVSIEFTNKCNLKCIMCYHGSEEAQQEPYKALSDKDIKTIMDECKEHQLPSMIVGNATEPLVAKNIADILRSAHDAGIMDIFLRTNGLLFDKKMADLVFDLKIPRVYFSLDAATQETYKVVRRSDQLKLIESNILHLLKEREKRKSVIPIVRLSFVVLKENQHERKAFLQKWEDKADYVDFQRYQANIYVTNIRKDIAMDTIENPYCAYPFYNLTIMSSGDIQPCCDDYGKNLVLGRIPKDRLKDVWQGPMMNILRRQFLQKRLNNVCKSCLYSRDADIDPQLNEVSFNPALANSVT